MKRNWIDKTKELPEAFRAIECKDKDGDILIGTTEGQLFLEHLKNDYILKWRYKQPIQKDGNGKI